MLCGVDASGMCAGELGCRIDERASSRHDREIVVGEAAPGWPGDPPSVEEARKQPDLLAGHGIDEVTEHYAQVIAGLDSPPILVGHSFGGTIVEKLLGQGLGVAGIAIDAAPIKGVCCLSPFPLCAQRSPFSRIPPTRTGPCHWMLRSSATDLGTRLTLSRRTNYM